MANLSSKSDTNRASPKLEDEMHVMAFALVSLGSASVSYCPCLHSFADFELGASRELRSRCEVQIW